MTNPTTTALPPPTPHREARGSTPEVTPEGAPEVVAHPLNPWQWVTEKCPYCSKRHVHGRGRLGGNLYGLRNAHCHNGGVYVLVPPPHEREQCA